MQQQSEQFRYALRWPMRLRWLGYLTSAGALVTSIWTIYLTYEQRGVLVAFLALMLLSLCYGAGPALMLAVASSFLCFHFHVVGMWLPIISYVVAVILLFSTLQANRTLNTLQGD